MPTLAEVLRQTGYSQDGTLAAPAPIEPTMTSILQKHIASIPQKFNENQAGQMDLLARAYPGNTFKSMMTEGDNKALAELAMQVPFNALTAFHGTPHKILGKFDINKVGTGEGAQAYGHGMYFAEAPTVAETYKRAGGGLEIKYGKPLEEIGINPEVTMRSMDFDANPLNQGLGRIAKSLRTTALDYPDVPVNQSLVKEHFDEYIRLLDDKYPKDAAQKKALQDLVAKEGYPDINFGGNLYKVDIPDADIPSMVNWDQQLKNQPNIVKTFIQNNIDELTADMHKFKPDSQNDVIWDKLKGIDLMTWANEKYGKPKAAELLGAEGIKGIRYLDEASRSKGKGTSNFVVFEPSTVKILEENAKPMNRKALIEEQVKKLKD